MRPDKRRANIILAVAAGLFVIALVLKYCYPANKLAAAFLIITEASLAGGVADWFAVTALFRKPLGFPYHTALVPRNRERIIIALTQAIEQDFFNKQSIKDRISRADILDKFMQYAGKHTSKERVKLILDTLILELAQMIDAESVGRYAERLLKMIVRRQSVAPQAAALLRGMLQGKKGEEFYLAVVNELAGIVREEKTKDAIYNYLKQLKKSTVRKNWLASLITGVLEGLDGINLDDAATALHLELIRTMDEAAKPDHPLRQWFQTELAKIAGNLETTKWAVMIDDWKNDQLDRLSLAEPLTVLTQAVLAACKQPSVYRDSVVDWLSGQLERYWQRFKDSAALQSQAELYLKTLLINIMDKEHSIVGQVAGSALRKLSDEELIGFIENKAGEDLDWIRINGVIVGGLIGLVLAMFKYLI